MSVSQDTTAPAAEQGCGDKRRLVKTKTPGVFKRIDGKGRTIGYACVYRSGARQRKRHARSYEEAKRIKRESETDRDRGELQERSAVTLRRYLALIVPGAKGCGTNLRLKSLSLGYAFRRGQTTFHLQRERLRSIASLQHEVYALVVDKARPCVELAIAA